MFNIGVDGQLMIGALGATITAFALQGQVPSPVNVLASLAVGTASARSGASSPASSRRARAPMR